MPLRYLTAGESHGPGLTAILEGMPAGLRIDQDALSQFMARRQKAFGSGGRMKIERDRAEIRGGVMAGKTTGAPIALWIENRDWANWRDRDIEPMTIPRPGHADLTSAIKYGYGDLRLGLERASARETAARAAIGGICIQLLDAFGVQIGSYVRSIGDISATFSPSDIRIDKQRYRDRFATAEADEYGLRCPDSDASRKMQEAIRQAIKAGDTLGGIFELVALGLPPGLGSHVHADRRLSGRLMAAIGSIQAIKGVEIGPAFENAGRRGSQVHDDIILTDDPDVDGDDRKMLRRASNRAGGLEGGITTGEALIIRAAMKPISTTLDPRQSVDLASGEPAETRYERSDFCAVPRAAVVGEAMLAFVLADAMLRKLGGDSLDEITPRLKDLRRGLLGDLPMDNRPWRFDE